MPPCVDGFAWRESPAGRVLVSIALEAFAPHAFTTRALAFRGPSAAGDGARLERALGVGAGCLQWVRQVHGRSVLQVAPDGSGLRPAAGLVEADAIVSTDPSRAILVHVADCVPILLADRRGRAVAAVHAGWRGTAAGVAGAAVAALARHGIEPADLVAAIGPSIGPCCYQVDAPVRQAFATFPAAGWFTVDDEDRWRLDLWRANGEQLVAAGLSAAAIHQARLCTRDHPDLCHSYRRDGAGAGRQAAAIRLAGSSERYPE
jgi:YfiH family protein